MDTGKLEWESYPKIGNIANIRKFNQQSFFSIEYCYYFVSIQTYVKIGILPY